jgi:hypothetical protein
MLHTITQTARTDPTECRRCRRCRNNALVGPVVLPAALTNAPASSSASLPTLELAPPCLYSSQAKPTKATMHEETPSPCLSIPLPGCYMCHLTRRPASPPGDPAETLRRIHQPDDPLLPHQRHDISFMPNDSLKSTQFGPERNGGGAGSPRFVVYDAH